jgi:muconolactone delta-isomerase
MGPETVPYVVAYRGLDGLRIGHEYEGTMLFLLRARLAKPSGMSNNEFYGVWEKEAEAALGAVEAGAIKHIFKVAGKHEVIAVCDFPDGDIWTKPSRASRSFSWVTRTS